MAPQARVSGRFDIVLPLAATLGAMAAFQVGASLAAKGLFPAVGPEGAAALRLALGAVMLVAIARPWRSWPRPAPLLPLFGLGVSMGLTITMFYLALSRLPQGIAIALQFLGPLTVAVVGSRRPSDLIWALLAGVGVWLMVGVAAAGGRIDPLGVAFALAAAAGWGNYIIIGRIAGAAFGRATAALAVSIAAVVAAPAGLWRAGVSLFSPGLLPLALAVALLAAALPFSLELYALRRLPARTFAVFTSLEPALGVLSGFLVLGERLSAFQLAGVAAVIAAAAGAATTRPQTAPGDPGAALEEAPPA
jgi:inner membrane transporter RhtA